jgi:hypothetical protein
MWTLILETAALLVLIAYTFFAGAQWLALLDSIRVSRDAITNTNGNFVKDQRPYIWVTPQKPEFALHQPAWWNIQYSNYGRSPALDVKLCTHLGYGSSILSVIKPVPIAECFKERGSTNSSSIIPPGWIGYTTAGDGTILGQPDINAITQYDGGLAVVGIFEYKDREGNSYSTTFCSFRFRNGAMGSCDKYNEIK